MNYNKGYNNNKKNFQNFSFGNPRMNQNQPMKIRSGAKIIKTDEKGLPSVSAWKYSATHKILHTFYFNVSSKKAKSVMTGKNGKKYVPSVPVQILNKATLQKSFAWGIWSVDGRTLTINELGIYITLKNGGFVGKIKS